MSTSRWHHVTRVGLATLGCLYVFLLFPPWRFRMPGASLDASWLEAIGYAAQHGWQWGSDLVFTYGPLGYILYNPYVGGSIAPALIFNTFMTLALAQGLIALLPSQSLWSSLTLFLLLAFPAAFMGPPAYTFLAPLMALVYFQRPDRRWHWRAVMLAAAAGVFALIYVSATVLGLAISAALDLSRLGRRRWPIFVPVFVAAYALSYAAAGQDFAHLPEFLRSVIEFVSGYPGAMSLIGNAVELIAYVVASAVLFAAILWLERGRFRGGDDGRDAVLLVAAIAIAWFIAFKSGFVRHDYHSVAAWQTLAMTAAAYAALRWRDGAAARPRWALVALSVVASLLSASVAVQTMRPAAVGQIVHQVIVQKPMRALREAQAPLLHSRAWKKELLAQRMQALAEIRTLVPLPPLDGTVDAIPSIQSAVLAHRLRYRPRPVIQDYAAYTPWLIERNRAYYRSPRAAEYILFRPEFVDRYPLLDQSAAVNELLTYYDPLTVEHDLLVLKRRPEPMRATVAPAAGTARLGQWVAVDRVDAPMLLSVRLAPTLVGRLAATLFRPPILTLSVRLADGQSRQFRLIERNAQSGFLLSPLAETPQDFAAVALNMWDDLRRLGVTEFKIDTLAGSSRRFYQQVFGYTLAVVHLEPADARPQSRSLFASLKREQAVRMLARHSSRNPPLVAQGSQLYVHPPTQATLRVSSAKMLRFTFFIDPGAWSEGRHTDGVCFRIFASGVDAIRRQVFERCLDPVARPADRLEQTAEIPIGWRSPGTLLFETTCRNGCLWDWSYWKDIDIQP